MPMDMIAKVELMRIKLETLAQPVSALELSIDWGIVGGRETKRRRVREAVDYARRERGFRICANGQGYWLARSDEEWRAYLEARKSGAKFEFVRTRRMAEAATDLANDQKGLFGSPERTECFTR